MGIFSRFKRATAAKVNAAVDKAIDPKKELEMAIMTMEEQRKEALKELLSFKTTAKQLERDIGLQTERVKKLEERAMIAVRGGNDELARTCLRDKKAAEVELAQMVRDRDESVTLALDLNRSRKQLEAKLQTLKLKKGTMAAQLAAARGRKTPLGDSKELFDKLDRAADAIEDDAIQAEAMTELDLGVPGVGVSADISDGWAIEDDALAALKAKMAADKKPKLPPGESK